MQKQKVLNAVTIPCNVPQSPPLHLTSKNRLNINWKAQHKSNPSDRMCSIYTLLLSMRALRNNACKACKHNKVR